MDRSEKRELAFKLIYSIEIQKSSDEEAIELFLENEVSDESAKKYMKDIIKKIIENEEEINNLISNNLKENWEISRLSKIDLALLKLAICEIKYTDTPFKVVINEVVELAKKYGEEQSPSFINGVLAKLV